MAVRLRTLCWSSLLLLLLAPGWFLGFVVPNAVDVVFLTGLGINEFSGAGIAVLDIFLIANRAIWLAILVLAVVWIDKRGVSRLVIGSLFTGVLIGAIHNLINIVINIMVTIVLTSWNLYSVAAPTPPAR